MELAERYRNVGIIGAAGKMGSGIALLLCQQMAQRALSPGERGQSYRLVCMDVSEEGLVGLRRYLAEQLQRSAEKLAVWLREAYADRADLVENGEIIAAFVQDALAQVRTTTELGTLKSCTMVFEAIAENIDLKVKVYRQLKELCGPDTFFFTNTSSIPISLLDDQVGLDGRIVGYHFYNPPAIQKLLELITSSKTRPALVEVSKQVAADLRKIVIPANDIAGFIGNGHFIRDGLYGISEMERLAKEHGFAAGVYMTNRVSQDWLVRPMGIFQLIDYVGVDVFQCILGVMNRFIEGEDLHSPLIDRMMELGVRGGQNPDGSQKDGFFKYEKGRMAAVYDLERRTYQPLDPAWTAPIDEKLGALPAQHKPWKTLSREADKEASLKSYFAELHRHAGLGSRLGCAYLSNSKKIGQRLVDAGVAQDPKDVNGVLMNGFFHLYGPINDHC